MTDKDRVEQCKVCRGKGTVWVNLNDFNFGRGFREFMSAGCFQKQDDTGATFHEMVCPRCDGVCIVLSTTGAQT